MNKLKQYIGPPEFYRKVARIGIPICLQQMLNYGTSLLDTLMVSYISAVSAVTVATQLDNLLFIMAFGFNSTISVFAAQFFGIKNYKNLKRSFGLYILINILAASVFFLLAQLGRTGLLSFYSKDPALLNQAWEYLSISSFAFFFTSLTTGFTFIYRCIQRTKVPMLIGIGVNVVNAILNYLLIFGKLGLPRMEVRGAALATVIATGLGLLVHIIYAVRTRQIFLGTFRELTDWPANFIRPILKRMLPLASNEILFGLGDTFYVKAYGSLGTAMLESYKVALSISMIPYSVTMGVNNACAVMVGELLGRKDFKEAKRMVSWFFPTGAILALILTVLMLMVARPAVGLFALSSPALREGTVLMAKLFAIRVVTRMFNVILMGPIRAGGDSLFLMGLDSGLVWLCGIPLAFGGIYLGITSLPVLYVLVQTEQILRMILGFWRYRSGKWIHNLTDGTQ